jgi:hypothetical protein
MSLFDWIRGKIEHETEHPRRSQRIPPERTDTRAADAPLKAGESHFRISLPGT